MQDITIKKIEKEYWVDYPYLGIGEKPFKPKKHATEEDLERIIGG